MIYLFIYLFIFMIFFCGSLHFFFSKKVLLINLLSLEYMILSLFFFYLLSFHFELIFLMLFLTLSVCESAVGVGLLIYMVRNYGNNYFNSLMFFLC